MQTLRYYNDIGLLIPKEVDNFTSYRYYNDDNLSDEILLAKRKKLIENIIKEKETIKLIDNIRSNIVDGKIKLEKYDYEIKNIITKKKGRSNYE